MNSQDFFSHPLTRQEKIWGSRWLLFETILFASMLQRLNLLLPAPLPQPEVNFIFFTVNFAVTAVIFRKFLWQQLQLIPEALWKVLFTAVPGFMLYWVLSFLTSQGLLALDPDFFSINDVTVQKLVAEDYWLMLLSTVLLVPVAEECLFRGLVFRGIYDRSPVLAWIFSVMLFCAVHVSGYTGAYPFTTILLCFVQYIPAGVCLAGAYRLSGSLLAPILMHAMVNFLGMLALR